MAGEKDNAAIRDAIAKSPERTARRLEGVGFDRDAYDFSGYSDADIVRSLQGGTYGDEDYARLTGMSTEPDSKPEPESEPTPEPVAGPVTVDAPITVGGDVMPGTPKRPMPNPGKGSGGKGGGINQYVDQSRTLGSSFIGNVTGSGNSIDLSNTDNSYNSVTGNDYRPDFMKFLR